jgi:hypothetical protein
MVNYRMLTVFAITTLIFLIGIFLGQAIAQYHLSDAKKSQNKLIADLAGYELACEILSEQDLCSIDFTPIQKDRFELGQKVSALEEEFGRNNAQTASLSELYHTYQLREYLLVKEAKNACSQDTPLIIFFYRLDDTDSIAQGRILDRLSEKYNLTAIYAINSYADNPAVRTIKSVYNVHTAPALVINEVTYNKYMRLEEIEEVLYKNIKIR